MAENEPIPSKISTYMFLDFESTGLLDRVRRPRITELCLLAVNHVDMLDKSIFPRVANKLTLCLDPQKPIPVTASTITGLYNDSLEYQKPLSADTVKLITSFLDHLAKPVCLLAHNGNGFDFQLLNSELQRINQSLDPSLLCADTLEAFRSLDGLPARFMPLTPQQQTPVKLGSNHSSSPPPLKRKSTRDMDHVDLVKIQKTENKKDVQTSDQADKHAGRSHAGTITPENIINADKVKKRLSFEDENTNNNANTDDKKEGPESVNSARCVSHNICEDFSEIVEDHVYLTALENAEQNLRENAQNSSDKEEGSKSPNSTVYVTETHTNDSHTDQEQFSESIEDDIYLRALETAEQGLAENGQNTTSGGQNTTPGGQNTTHDGQNMTPGIIICPVFPPVNEPAEAISGNDTVSGSDGTCSEVFVIRAPASSVNESENPTVTNGSRHTVAEKGLAEPFIICPPVSTVNESENHAVTNGSGYILQKKHPVLNEDRKSPAKHQITEVQNTSIVTVTPSTASSSSSSTAATTPVKRNSYKLAEIYYRVFGKQPPASHKAEDDCITLVQVAKRTPGFMAWVEKNAVPLSSVKPQY